MSESYVSAPSNEPTAGQSGKADAAKHEASELKDTAATQAKNVVGTAKEEAKSVAGEAKYQVKDLYAQGKRQLSDQAGAQTQKVAVGLRSVGDELDSMAANSENGGVGADLVRNVSQRVGSAASWLDGRDPASILDEVKNYARRKPGIFIGGALIVGIVAGRLTRALAANAKDDASADTEPTYGTGYSAPDYTTTGTADPLAVDAVDTAPSGVYGSGVGVGGVYGEAGVTESAGYGGADLPSDGLTDEDTPLYAQSTASFDERAGEAGDDVRTDRV